MHYLSCLNGITSYDEAKQILQAKNLKIKEFGNHNTELYIVKYDKNLCDMTDQDVKKCRGLVLSRNDNSVVCPVPCKSSSLDIFNQVYNNNLNRFKVTDFVDGTMINLFKFKEETFISTRSCLNAKCRWYSKKTFGEMFTECLGSSPEKIDNLNMNYCYSFVIQHPQNTIVKKYLVPDLILVMVSQVHTNGEIEYFDVHDFVENNNLDFRVPTEFSFKSIEDVYAYVNSLSQSEQGVMIHDVSTITSNYRTKIRNTKYNKLRELKGETNNKLFLFFSLRKSGNGAYKNYLDYFEDDRKLFDSYRQMLYDFTQRLFQNYLDCFVNKNLDGTTIKNHKEIDYELKPLVAELHANYFKTKHPTTKNTVIQFLHELPIPRLIYSVTYSGKQDTSKKVETNNNGEIDNALINEENVIQTNETTELSDTNMSSDTTLSVTGQQINSTYASVL